MWIFKHINDHMVTAMVPHSSSLSLSMFLSLASHEHTVGDVSSKYVGNIRFVGGLLSNAFLHALNYN